MGLGKIIFSFPEKQRRNSLLQIFFWKIIFPLLKTKLQTPDLNKIIAIRINYRGCIPDRQVDKFCVLYYTNIIAGGFL